MKIFLAQSGELKRQWSSFQISGYYWKKKQMKELPKLHHKMLILKTSCIGTIYFKICMCQTLKWWPVYTCTQYILVVVSYGNNKITLKHTPNYSHWQPTSKSHLRIRSVSSSQQQCCGPDCLSALLVLAVPFALLYPVVVLQDLLTKNRL